MSQLDLSIEYADGRRVPITIHINDEAVAEYRRLQAVYDAAVEMYGEPKAADVRWGR